MDQECPRLAIEVTTRDATGAQVGDTREFNLYDHRGRAWMAKHCWWAAHEGFAVTSRIAGAAEPCGDERTKRALAELTDCFLEKHGCFPLDNTKWRAAMTEAYALVGQPNTPAREAAFASPASSGQGVSGEVVPDVAPGHWDTEGGRDMALATLDDPHMAASRARISDFALANAVFLSPGIGNLTDAKERIRWLSAKLAVKSAAPAPSCAPGEVERIMRAAVQDIADAEPIPTTAEAFEWCKMVCEDALARAAALSPQGLDAKEGGALGAAVENDALLFEQFATRMFECWRGTGGLMDEGSASNDYRVWGNEAHNRVRHLRALLRATPSQRLDAATVERRDWSGYAELVVVTDRKAGLRAGFDEHGRHPIDPNISAWWPGKGMRDLCARPPKRVTIQRDVDDRTPEGSLRAILRKRQAVFGAAAVWMEISW